MIAGAIFAALLSNSAVAAPLGHVPLEGPSWTLADRQGPRTVQLLSSDATTLQIRMQSAGNPVLLKDGVLMAATEDPDNRRRDSTMKTQAPTFLHDYDEPAFALLLAEARASLGASPSATAVRDFVATTLTNKNLRHGFLIASQVAKVRAGDCTEHAVLATALARALGRPARLVLGYVLVPSGDKPTAISHAWTEVFEAGAWTAIDATKIRATVDGAYLRLGVFTREGADFTRNIIELLQPGVQAIRYR